MSSARLDRWALRAKRVMPDLERRVWLWLVAPAIICLSFLISVGPTVQETLVGLLSSGAPSVYAAAYEDSLVEFPTLGEWLLLGFHWLYLLMAAPPVLFAMCASRFSQFIVRLAAISFVILCAADVIFGVLNGTLTLSAFLINSAVNLAGSLLLILILGVIFWSYEKVRDLAPARLADYSSAATLVLLGVLLSSLCYFALTYFYQPLSTNFELVAKMPIHGGYVGQKEEEQEVGERARPFSILPEAIKGGRGHATIPGEVAIVDWKSAQPASIFDVTVEFFSDCPHPEDIRQLPVAPESIRRENVKTLKVIADEGMNELFIAEDPNNGFSYAAEAPSFFWLKKPDETRSETTAEFFGGPDAELVNRGSDGQLFYLSFALLRTDLTTGSSRVSSRNMKFTIDGEVVSFTFQRPKPLDPNAKIDCRAFKATIPGRSRAAKALTLDAPDGTLIVGARVSITPRAVETLEEFQRNANRLRIAKANGWSQVAQIEDSELTGKYLGEAELMIVESGLAELTIDGATVETKGTDQFVALGEMSGRYEDDLSLHVGGKARAVWLDSKRRNPTRWERLPLEVQLFILTAVFAVFGGILRILKPIVRRFREDKPLDGLA